jgi:4-hydroxy-tetrahydrodipicolinate reductase
MEDCLSTPDGRKITRLIVHGGGGRMGERVCALAMDDADVSLTAVVARGPRADLLRASTRSADTQTPRIVDSIGFLGEYRADVVVDFSSSDGTMSAVELARAADAALLVGTTGLGEEVVAALRREAARRAVLVAPNTSLGVAVLAELVGRAARSLTGYDMAIVESHHSAKRDAPSGTAKRLADAARRAGAPLQDDQILSLRGGDVVGEHVVRFAGPGEYVELTHRATSRDVFARGALRAAKWLHGRGPGWWTMEDALGIATVRG